MNVLSIKEIPIKGKRVLMRVDFNVPLDEDQKITDDTRIRAALPSIRYVLDQGGSLILLSHLDRPKGKKVSKLSLTPCQERLSALLEKPVLMAPDCLGKEVEEMAKKLGKGEILLLENLRFHRAEEHPEEDPEFAKGLASLGDIYVNDAFGSSHRAHSSITEVTKYFPGKAAAGFLLEQEIRYLGQTLFHPKRPFCALIGGAKISTKIGALLSLVEKADTLLIGGALAYTFLKAQGIPIGNSLCEEELIDTARDILKRSQEKKKKLFLPEDVVIADSFNNEAKRKTILKNKGIPDGWEGMDIGPKTIDLFAEELTQAKTIFWNGPVGVFEMPHFSKGTKGMAKAIIASGAISVVGGGDSIAALSMLKALDKVSHVSTGGGASLEYIEKGTLPGIEHLTPKIK